MKKLLYVGLFLYAGSICAMCKEKIEAMEAGLFLQQISDNRHRLNQEFQEVHGKLLVIKHSQRELKDEAGFVEQYWSSATQINKVVVGEETASIPVITCICTSLKAFPAIYRVVVHDESKTKSEIEELQKPENAEMEFRKLAVLFQKIKSRLATTPTSSYSSIRSIY